MMLTKKMKKELKEAVRSLIKLKETLEVISKDPMFSSGCPQDFYEDYGRKIFAQQNKIERILRDSGSIQQPFFSY